MDENGSDKDCYQSREDAQRRARILKKELGVTLNVYSCPETEEDVSGCIWHLTKKDPQQYATGRKSTTCTNKEGDYRMEYDTESDAWNGAEHVRERYGREVSAYECSSCGKWHIGDFTPSFTGRKSTTCRNKQGSFRTEYDTEEEAMNGANY